MLKSRKNNRKFVMLIDFDVPHSCGLVFEVQREINEYYVLKDLIDANTQEVYSQKPDLIKKDHCIEIDKNIEYCEMLLQRTIAILEFNHKN